MHFVLVREDSSSALERARHLDARLLRVNELLSWPALGSDSCFVVPLGTAVASAVPD